MSYVLSGVHLVAYIAHILVGKTYKTISAVILIAPFCNRIECARWYWCFIFIAGYAVTREV